MMKRADLERLIAEELSIAIMEASARREVRVDRLKPGDVIDGEFGERTVKSVRRKFDVVYVTFTDGDPFEPEQFDLMTRVTARRVSSQDAAAARDHGSVTLFGPQKSVQLAFAEIQSSSVWVALG